jgi:hypothetical protein
MKSIKCKVFQTLEDCKITSLINHKGKDVLDKYFFAGLGYLIKGSIISATRDEYFTEINLEYGSVLILDLDELSGKRLKELYEIY